jgi:chromosome partitioning protein
MIVTTGSIKGGNSKTTTATNLVIFLVRQNRKVLLVDADDQQSAAFFTQVRQQNQTEVGYDLRSFSGADLREQVQQLAGQYDDIIIDSGGRDQTSQRAAMTVSDAYLAPFAARNFDIWTAPAVSELVAKVQPINPRLRAFSFITRTDPRGTAGSSYQEAAEYLTTLPHIEFIPLSVGNRVAFDKAAGYGQSVLELVPQDAKASAEITSLFLHLQTALAK